LETNIVLELNRLARANEIDQYAYLLESLREVNEYEAIYKAGRDQIEKYRVAMLDAAKYSDGQQLYSMRNEQLHLKYLADLLEESNGHVIDIGAGDAKHWSNSYYFVERGWNATLIEGRADHLIAAIENLRPHEGTHVFVSTYVTPDTICELLAGCNTPPQFTFLTVDIDSYDYELTKKIFQRYRPKILCVEINERIPPPIEYYLKHPQNIGRTDMTIIGSASITSWNKMLRENGYTAYRLEYNNLIAVDQTQSEFKEIPQRTEVELYQDFKSLRDKNVLFPWNNRLYSKLLQKYSARDFTDIDSAELYEHFISTFNLTEKHQHSN
jgi:hypothetical protein